MEIDDHARVKYMIYETIPHLASFPFASPQSAIYLCNDQRSYQNTIHFLGISQSHVSGCGQCSCQ